MIKQGIINVTSTMKELVAANPLRTQFTVQNTDVGVIFAIYARKENPYGGYYLWEGCMLRFKKEDDCDKQWFVKSGATAGNIRLVEYFREEKRDPYTEWPR